MANRRVLRVDLGIALRRLLVVCVSVELLLFALDYRLYMANLTMSPYLRSIFNVASEDSLASWAAMLQTVLVALVAWLIWAAIRAEGTKLRRGAWLTIALFFTYLALDDGAFIHERVGSWFDDAAATTVLGASLLDAFPSYRWQLVYMPWFAVMGALIFLFLLRELKGSAVKLVVLAAFACLALAVVMDFFEGLSPDHALNPYTAIADRWHLDYWTSRTFDRSPYSTLVHFSKSIEECIELFGMSLLLLVFVRHLAGVVDGVRLRFDPSPMFGTARAEIDTEATLAILDGTHEVKRASRAA